ncbi:MAG: hypothetical protein ACREQN_11005 [Candidatus Binataceae bacterium]
MTSGSGSSANVASLTLVRVVMNPALEKYIPPSALARVRPAKQRIITSASGLPAAAREALHKLSCGHSERP